MIIAQSPMISRVVGKDLVWGWSFFFTKPPSRKRMTFSAIKDSASPLREAFASWIMGVRGGVLLSGTILPDLDDLSSREAPSLGHEPCRTKFRSTSRTHTPSGP